MSNPTDYQTIVRLRAELEDARGALSFVSSYVGQGLGDDTTSIQEYQDRIVEGIQHIIKVEEARRREIEMKYRTKLFFSHGHRGMYVDDGELQCGECMHYGFYDYKREPLTKIEAGLTKLAWERIAAGTAGENS